VERLRHSLQDDVVPVLGVVAVFLDLVDPNALGYDTYETLKRRKYNMFATTLTFQNVSPILQGGSCGGGFLVQYAKNKKRATGRPCILPDRLHESV
jgi:hypothetical protein